MAIVRNHQAEYSHWRPEEVKIIEDRSVRFCDVCVHEFVVSDVDDVEIYIAAPVWDWQQSAQGAWVMEHAVNTPYWTQSVDHVTYGYRVRIMARLSEQDQTFWRLKWGGLKR